MGHGRQSLKRFRRTAMGALLALVVLPLAGPAPVAAAPAAKPANSNDVTAVAQLKRGDRLGQYFGRARTETARALKLAARAQPAQPPDQSTKHAQLLCNGVRATIVGTEGDDVIQGTPGRDVIVGLGGNDEIHGRGQDDLICGGPGDDFILGEGGNDTLLGGEGHDILDGGLGNDTLDGGADDRDGAAFFDETGPVTASLATGTASGQGSDTFTNMEELHGGNYSDTFIGDAANNSLFGNGGNDSLSGGDGDDLLSGGPGDDAMDGGNGEDMVWFLSATGPVSASLLTGTSSGGDGSDTFLSVEDLEGGPFSDTLTGDSGANFILGDAENDTLSGGDGQDALDGGPGDDTMDGGAGDMDAAVFFDETGPVTASLVTGTATGQGADTFINMEGLHGGNFPDTFIGDAGNNNALFGNGGDDSLSGGDGDDFLSGGPGNDSIDGGNGYDVVMFISATGPVTASFETGSATGGDGSDSLANLEVMIGGPYGDTLIGGAGDDSMFGVGGDDTLVGGDGTDYLVPGSGLDTVDGGAGDHDAVDYLDASGPITASLVTNTGIGDGTDTLVNLEQIFGSPHDDHLAGGAADTQLVGVDGDDTITGGSGNDVLFGNNGNDTIVGGAGDDFLVPGSGIDTLDGGVGNDKAAYWDAPGPITASLADGGATGDGNDTFANLEGIHGSSFDDTFVGDSGDNELFGLDGNDTLSGGAGNDFLYGNNGNDTIDGGGGDDFLVPGSGIDTLDGGVGYDKAAYWDAPGPITASLASGGATGDGDDTFVNLEGIHGSSFDDTFVGDSGDNELFGLDGNDTLSGGAGNDILIAGSGDDRIYGDAGDDYIDGEDGFDSADGGPDGDFCVNVENSVNCEAP
jgi:Ca2+-binding RTX toxin-like protein